VYIQRLVFFDEGLAVEAQSLYRKLTEQEERLLDESEELGRQLGVRFNASGRTTPTQSLGADPAPDTPVRPWMACRRPWELSYITAEGEVLPCCFVPFVTNAHWQDFVLGNVQEQRLDEIWNGERYREFRRRFLSAEPPECCRGCGVKWSV
jgi:radical SAM protein with 4Fe4S-binding SPASM domain